VRNMTSFKTSLNSEPHAFENAAIYLNSERKVQCCDDRPMSWPSLAKLDARIPEKNSATPRKIARRKRAKSSITQPWIIRFGQILYRV